MQPEEQNPNPTVLDHMLSQREEHHAQSCGQMDTLIHQNEELKRIMAEGFAKLTEAILSLSLSPAHSESEEPQNMENQAA